MAVADRMLRAAQGQVALFEEVEHDPSATTQALTVVIVVAVASGIGQALSAILTGNVSGIVGGLIIGVLQGVLGWAVFAGVTYFLGTKLFNAEATWEEVLRTLGFSEAPNVLQVLVFIPILGWLVAIAAGFWSLYLAFVAIRSALDISSGQTIATILLAIIPTAIVFGILSIPLALFK